MILSIFSIHDAKSGGYITPFFLQNEAMALRELENAANNPDHAFGRNPEDYALYSLGTFDVISGELVPTYPPAHVIQASGLVKKRSLEQMLGSIQPGQPLDDLTPEEIKNAFGNVSSIQPGSNGSDST